MPLRLKCKFILLIKFNTKKDNIKYYPFLHNSNKFLYG